MQFNATRLQSRQLQARPAKSYPQNHEAEQLQVQPHKAEKGWGISFLSHTFEHALSLTSLRRYELQHVAEDI
jgi:hypothetical protein